MPGNVKGLLFVDYVRMLRAHRDESWAEYLEPSDTALVNRQVELEAWYPMEAFERLGIAILKTVAGADLEMVLRHGCSG